MANMKGGSMPTTTPAVTPGNYPGVLSQTDKELINYRVGKLYRAGFSYDTAEKIAAEIYAVMDSDDAIKLFNSIKETDVFVDPERAVLFFLGLIEEMPKKN